MNLADLRERLLTLAERCERATGEYDPALCDTIHSVLPEPKCIQPPNYCASIDAAMTLVPEGLTWRLHFQRASHGHSSLGSAFILAGEEKFNGDAATPALALCAAALRSRAGGEHDNG